MGQDRTQIQAALLQSVSRWPSCSVALVVLHSSYPALNVTSPPPGCLAGVAWLGWPWVADGLMHKELAEALVPAASQLRGAGFTSRGATGPASPLGRKCVLSWIERGLC